MQIEVQAENAYARKVTVTIPSATVGRELDAAFERVGQRARVPGFRKGKVPRPVLEARFGPGVREDVANNLINRAYRKALADHQLLPVNRPSVQAQGEIVAGAAFAFTIALEVRPQVTAANYTGLDVIWPGYEVTEAEITADVERRRGAMARLGQVEGRPVQSGDTVQVELKVYDGGELVVDEPGTLVQTAQEVQFKGLGAALEGLSIGESFSGDVSFADDARVAAVAGRTLRTEAKVLAIMARVVPELTDALAEEMGFEGGLAGMRAKIAENLGKGREEHARNMARANLLQALIDANPFEVPAGMVDQNLQLLIEEFKLQQAMRGVDPRNLTFNNATIADLRNRAAFAAKGALLLESIARQESLEATDADVEAKIEELARSRGQTVEAIRAYFAKDDGYAELRDRILEEKTLDWLLGAANVRHEAPGEDATEAAPAADAEAPKAKRAAKKAEAPAAEAPAAEVEEAPKKKRSTKKAAEEAAAEEAAAEEAPKKKRSTKKAAADEG